jgi:ABC-type antimicrobial peptide transport system permease subunit
MLIAVGMSKIRIFVMIMLESMMLTFAGAVGGMLMGYLSINWMGQKGLDLAGVAGDSMNEFGYDTVIYPVISSQDFISIVILVIATVLLSAVYPSFKALKIKPSDVVRE